VRPRWAAAAVAAALTVLAVWNPWHFVRVDPVMSLLVGAGLIGLVLILSRPLRASSFVLAFVMVVAVGCGGMVSSVTTGEWIELARSGDGDFALVVYSGWFNLGPDHPYEVHLWAGSGWFARDQGELAVVGGQNLHANLDSYEFVAPRTLRFVVGDDEHVYDIDGDGRPQER
jgi:hypothetical protein